MTTSSARVWHQYHCARCDVGWRAANDERIPDICWLCEKNDQTKAQEQLGRPVEYFDSGDK